MAMPWTEAEAAHLLNRATFLATEADVAAALKLGMEETVNRLIGGVSLTDRENRLPPPEEVNADGKPLNPDNIGDQQTYWINRMVRTEAPLIEKMTLFWHGHFATSYQKVREVRLMVKQNELFRKLAVGSFRDLVLAIGRDPAMMIWLDSNSNRKGKPNENYAREVMELFTLGIGHYTETDIREAARALTGWTVNKDTGEVKFNKSQHDQDTKQVLGEQGNFDEAGFVEVLFKQKALPDFMAQKLLAFFGDPAPSQEWIDQVSTHFAAAKTVGEVLANLFTSDEFYAPSHRLSLIKTPAEYVAGIVKAFDLPLSGSYAGAMRRMGQELYLPPNVAGWSGGTTWLMSTSLLARYQFAESVSKKVKSALLASSGFIPARSSEPDPWVEQWGKHIGLRALSDQSLKTMSKFVDDTFLHAAQKNNGMRGLLHLLMICPEAQMK